MSILVNGELMTPMELRMRAQRRHLPSTLSKLTKKEQKRARAYADPHRKGQYYRAPETVTLEEAVEQGLITEERAHKIREAHFTEQYSKILEEAEGKPIHFDPETGGYYWEVPQEEPPPPTEPKVPMGPGRGPRLGSIGYRIAQPFQRGMEAFETKITAMTMPLVEFGKSQQDKSLLLFEEGKPLKGFGAYMAGVTGYTAHAFVEGLTFPIRPIRWGETISGVTSLITDAEAQKQFRRTIAKDPFTFAMRVGGGVAGGYTFGKITSKILDVTLGKPKGTKEFITYEKQVKVPRRVTTTTTKRVLKVQKDPTKVHYQKFRGWDKLSRDIDKSASEWFAGKQLGGRASTILEHDPMRYIYRPRIETITGFRKVMEKTITKSTRTALSTRTMMDFYSVIKAPKDILPSALGLLGGVSTLKAPPTLKTVMETRGITEARIKVPQRLTSPIKKPIISIKPFIETIPFVIPKYTLRLMSMPMIKEKTITTPTQKTLPLGFSIPRFTIKEKPIKVPRIAEITRIPPEQPFRYRYRPEDKRKKRKKMVPLGAIGELRLRPVKFRSLKDVLKV